MTVSLCVANNVQSLNTGESTPTELALSVASKLFSKCNSPDLKINATALQVLIKESIDASCAKISASFGVDNILAQRIFQASQNQWNGFYQYMSDGFLKQTHGIPGLKIYTIVGSTQILVDFGQNQAQFGSFKRVKSFRRFGVELPFVRLTSPSKAKKYPRPLTPEQEQEILTIDVDFRLDVQREIAARAHLAGIHNVTFIQYAQYYNENDVLKTRYIMRQYERNLFSIIWKERNPLRALTCLRGVINALGEIHQRNFFHGDLKSSNILVLGREGFLNDFGCFGECGKILKYQGNLVYMAPETYFPKSVTISAKMDMFSLGMILLEILSPKTSKKWNVTMCNLTKDLNSKKDFRLEYVHFHRLLMKEIEGFYATSSFFKLINSLIQYSPDKRPTIEEIKPQFERSLQEITAIEARP